MTVPVIVAPAATGKSACAIRMATDKIMNADRPIRSDSIATGRVSGLIVEVPRLAHFGPPVHFSGNAVLFVQNRGGHDKLIGAPLTEKRWRREF
jgi:hypothetical protein